MAQIKKNEIHSWYNCREFKQKRKEVDNWFFSRDNLGGNGTRYLYIKLKSLYAYLISSMLTIDMIIAHNLVFWTVLILYSSHASSVVAQDTCDEYMMGMYVNSTQSHILNGKYVVLITHIKRSSARYIRWVCDEYLSNGETIESWKGLSRAIAQDCSI